MRKVKYKKWINPIWKESQIGKTLEPNTTWWEKDYTHNGLFHQWGAAYEESSEGFGNFTLALVEIEDGTIVEVLPCNIKFINE